jgi:hypothetical protein
LLLIAKNFTFELHEGMALAHLLITDRFVVKDDPAVRVGHHLGFFI